MGDPASTADREPSAPARGVEPSSAPTINSPQWWEDYFLHHWDANGGAEQTRHFMQRLIEELPVPEGDHLRHRARSILDWGCAHGEGVDELVRAFPAAEVQGLDVAPAAVAEARRRFPSCAFVLATDDAIPRADVIVCSNCLEHFRAPWEIAERLATAASDLLILLVPHAEDPLCASHVVRFDAEDFPQQIGELRRLECKRIAMDPRHWAGEQMLAIYGSSDYLAKRGADAAPAAEREQWDRHYGGAAPESESETMARFAKEFAAVVCELLPDGGRVLEAGAGAGWHALALARTGKFALTLMDFSAPALRHARALFASAGQHAEFVLADAREHGAAEYDLVFNSGVLEHYGFAEQVDLLRGMASRSRDLVLALVPNSQCYWYWVWRVRAAANGDWPFGREELPRQLSSAFAAAGLDVLGERVLGSDWTESFLEYLLPDAPDLRECLREVHASPLIAAETKAYLRCALGSVREGGRPVPVSWQPAAQSASRDEAVLSAALADALALQVGTRGELLRARAQSERTSARADAEAASAERLRAELEAHAAAAAQRAQEQGAEIEALRARVAALQSDGEASAVARERVEIELRATAEDRDRLAAARAQVEEQLGTCRGELDGAMRARAAAEQAHESAERARQSAERARAAAEQDHRALQEWQRYIEASRTFRWLQRLKRLRARFTRQHAGG